MSQPLKSVILKLIFNNCWKHYIFIFPKKNLFVSSFLASVKIIISYIYTFGFQLQQQKPIVNEKSKLLLLINCTIVGQLYLSNCGCSNNPFIFYDVVFCGEKEQRQTDESLFCYGR